MNIHLIDADSVIPNLALMKLSAYHKAKGHNVVLTKLKLPYYPNKKKVIYTVPKGYNRTYCSVVYEGNIKYILGKNIIFGGTGFSLSVNLPDKIELLSPDYSIYPDNDISYGFISRGCIRKCYFCVVSKKEGYIRQVATVNDIVQHKKVIFLDGNFLALPNHKNILKELILKQILCQFNQGFDIRLIDEENSILLSQLNYIGELFFAFDDWNIVKQVERQLSLLSWRKDWQLRFYLYCNPKKLISNVVKRMEYMQKNKCLIYIMRDISCWNSCYSSFYVDIACYGNYVSLFKRLSFADFLIIRHFHKKISMVEYLKIKDNDKIYDRIRLSNELYIKNI